ncbi:uncharacterized protein Z518_10096 [Rhinocladiella mackenziei CBS 650.93]|uniref:Rhinocladiella mackenziei CBS 650.93 unplaced genomic scaffold supercont1.8, whole genome shotgun sequence n=1 Tax=Rhinocladiella mackenziei CBS 650.93 TaxID=1442369 RepID=A0A0D2IWQ0_9EURO|nr:uncharacterized protein Z518_10096 [Rhinocladiella mackenziei CBS 650.93]KIX01030.1 hypothetical protein Z518_10096 [Rhinocladiella mackenziei CBS 650.93]
MTNVTYDPQTTIASIQLGPRWRDVYADLAPHNVVSMGGRDGDVGVAGFLTGGGNSYYAGRAGLAIDTVVNYEIVLASGKVVNTNKSSNPDLWKALKGGSGSSFGIVTRFDVETLPAVPLWGGMAVHNQTASNQLATALVNFNENNYKNPQDAYLLLSTYNSLVPSDTIIASVIIDTEGTVNASAFSEALQVPAIQTDRKTRSLEEVTVAYQNPGGARIVRFTLTTNNDVEIVKHIWQSHDQIVEDFKASLGSGSFSTQCVVQPLPAYFADISVKKGGNVLGLDSVNTNSILWLGTAAYQNATYDQLVHGKMQNWTANIQSFAKSRAGAVQWQYVNYADSSQSPLGSYGNANVDFIQNSSQEIRSHQHIPVSSSWWVQNIKDIDNTGVLGQRVGSFEEGCYALVIPRAIVQSSTAYSDLAQRASNLESTI